MVSIRGIYKFPNDGTDAIPIPVSVQPGDLMLIYTTMYNTDTAKPSGWVVVQEAQVSGTYTNYADLWMKIAGPTDAGSIVSVPVSGASYGGTILIVAFNAVIAGSGQSFVVGSYLNAPAIVSSVADNVAFSFLSMMGNSSALPTYVPSSGGGTEVAYIPAPTGSYFSLAAYQSTTVFPSGTIPGGSYSASQTGSYVLLNVALGTPVVVEEVPDRPTRGQLWPRSGGAPAGSGPEIVPSTGISLALSAPFSMPALATNIPWTAENFKDGITHDAGSSNIVIQAAGPYLISGKFTNSTTGSAIRDFFVQVNGTTIGTASTDAVAASATRGVADFPSRLVNLAVGDVVSVVSSGATTHTLASTSDTWLSIAKFSGTKGDTGTAGDDGGEGPQGIQGETGAGLIIIGTLPDVGDLPTTGEPGDAYIIEDELWIWSTLLEDWENVGPITSGGGGGGPAAVREEITYTTASLPPGASETGLVALGRSYRVLKTVLSRQGRVRLYDTVAHRNADVARAPGLAPDPTTDHGLMMDVALQTGALSRTMTPTVDGVNFESADLVPITVNNLGTSAGTVGVTLTIIKTEG